MRLSGRVSPHAQGLRSTQGGLSIRVSSINSRSRRKGADYWKFGFLFFLFLAMGGTVISSLSYWLHDVKQLDTYRIGVVFSVDTAVALVLQTFVEACLEKKTVAVRIVQSKNIRIGIMLNLHFPLALENLSEVSFAAPWQPDVPAFYAFDFDTNEEERDTWID